MKNIIISGICGLLAVTSLWGMEVSIVLADGEVAISQMQHKVLKQIIDETFAEAGNTDCFQGVDKESFSLIINSLEDIAENSSKATKKIGDELYESKKYKAYARLVRAADFLGIDSIVKYVNDNLHTMIAQQPEFVEALLSAAVVPYGFWLDIDQKDKWRKTLLIKAAFKGRLKIVQAIFALGGSLNERDCQDRTALHWASRKGLVNLVKYLVDRGADMNKQSKSGYTPLMSAARNGRIRCLKILIDAGADLNVKSKCVGYTALMMASMAIREACVKFLLAAGADCDVQDDKGYTALMWATKVYGELGADFVRVVEQLLEHGARTDIFAKDGRCAYNLALIDYKNEILCNLLEKAAEKQKAVEQ